MTLTSPTIKSFAGSKFVTLAAGCFWGVERAILNNLKGRGIVDAKVGYAAGGSSKESSEPVTYQKVCSGSTGLAEALQVTYDPLQLHLKDVLDIFFRIHDPTTVNSQGPDVGTQYRSAIFVHDAEDLAVAKESKEFFQKEWYPNHTIATAVEPISVWYDAEDYHQEYLDKNPGGYECPTHFLRTKPKA